MKTMKIFGPPGTGKTTTLISTLGKLLERGYHPSEIAYLSHTKAAAVEARDRIARQFDGYDLKKDFVWFRTIHSACCGIQKIGYNEIMGWRDLKKFSQETGFQVKGSIDMDTAIDQTEGEQTHDVILNALSLASHRMVHIDVILDELPDSPALASAHEFIEAYKAFKKDVGKLDYVDMLEVAKGKSLPVKVILVDECQDLSDLQWSLIHSFAEGCDYLYLAGDDDQAIYEFMGSSNNGFLDHDADKQVILDHSYRCPQTVGKAAEDIIRRVAHREEKDVNWQEAEGEVWRVDADLESMDWQRYMDGTKDFMVLFRHQKQVHRFGYMLQDLDVPYTIKGTSIATDAVAHIIKVFLQAREGLKFTPATMGVMMRKAGDDKAANAARMGFEHDDMIEREDCPNFDWGMKNWPKAFAKNYGEEKKLYVLERMIQAHGIEILGRKPKIDIGTYHGSKGREADVVILNTDCYKRTWEEQINNPDVETRLCFVGVTRAKERLVILAPRTDMYMRALVEA